jgi:hypothetical protein
VTGQVTTRHAQLRVYGFGPGADFEGRLPGGLERIESGGTVRILEALFVANDPETGELVAVDLTGDAAGGIVAPLLLFRSTLPSGATRPSARCALTAAASRLRGCAS